MLHAHYPMGVHFGRYMEKERYGIEVMPSGVQLKFRVPCLGRFPTWYSTDQSSELSGAGALSQSDKYWRQMRDNRVKC